MDKKELENLYNEYFPKIYKFCYYKSQDKQVAEDITSETFLTLAEYLNNGKKIENINGLLFVIAKNIFNKYLKRKYSESSIDFDTYDIVTKIEESETLISKKDEMLEKLTLLIQKLPAKQKKVMELRFLEKMKLNEVAQELKKDLNYVKTTQRRALKNLKEFIALE